MGRGAKTTISPSSPLANRFRFPVCRFILAMFDASVQQRAVMPVDTARKKGQAPDHGRARTACVSG
jgi:hypothetical protein